MVYEGEREREQAWELMFFNSNIGFVSGILQWLLGGVGGLHRREGEGQAWELMFFNSNIGFVCGILQWLLGEGVGGLHRGRGTGLGTDVLQLYSVMYEIDSICNDS